MTIENFNKFYDEYQRFSAYVAYCITKDKLLAEEETYQRLVLRKLRMRNPQNYDILIKTKMHRIPASEVAEEYGITTNNVNNRNLRSKAWIIEELEKLRRQSHL